MAQFPRPVANRHRFEISVTISIAIIALWWLLARTLPAEKASVFLPAPPEVLSYLGSIVANGELFADVGMSGMRIVLGVLFGSIGGVGLGVLIASDKRIEAAADPITSALRYTPLTAFIPLLMLKLGIGEIHKVTVLALGIFVQMLPVVVDTLRSVERNYLDIAHSYGLGARRLMFSVVLPRSMPALVDSVRASLAIGWAYVVLVEFWGSDVGLGHRLWRGQRFSHPEQVYACAVITGLMGLASDLGIRWLRRTLFRWEYGRTLGTA